MKTTATLIDLLSQTPTALDHLLELIPADRHDRRRTPERWSVKEWLCHLIDAQRVLVGRFKQFESEDDPLIADYEPPLPSDTRYRDRDLDDAISEFTGIRAETVNQLRGYDTSFWARRGRHESYSPYGTRILLSHMLNVDYAHLFGIESAGLSSDVETQG